MPEWHFKCRPGDMVVLDPKACHSFPAGPYTVVSVIPSDDPHYTFRVELSHESTPGAGYFTYDQFVYPAAQCPCCGAMVPSGDIRW